MKQLSPAVALHQVECVDASAPPKWTLSDAVELCCVLEVIAPQYGAHVGLTGGTLYKDGPRKDVDILFYRIRQVESIDVLGLMEACRAVGVEPGGDYGWCHKATFRGKKIDFFFPEREGVEYPAHDLAPSLAPLTEAADDIIF
jgi:hypothetical protein